MTPEALAALHARCFEDMPRPWRAAEFAALAAAPGTVLLTDSGGFALGRIAGPEAELLTLAVAPERRRSGLGTALVAAFEATVAAAGAEEVYLEVAETNLAARALYAGCGFREVGRRPGYYRAAGHAPVAALVMRKALSVADLPAPGARKTD